MREGLYGVGQESEQEAADYLVEMGYFVIPISEYTNNTGKKINAPMVMSSEGKMIGPDLFGIKDGKDVWFEVKRKKEPTYFFKRREWQHGVDSPNMIAYRQVQERTGKPLIILVHEIFSPKTPDLDICLTEDSCAHIKVKEDLQPVEMWLSINLDDAFKFGQERPGNFEMVTPRNRDGKGIYWPRDKMFLLPWNKENREAD